MLCLTITPRLRRQQRMLRGHIAGTQGSAERLAPWRKHSGKIPNWRFQRIFTVASVGHQVSVHIMQNLCA